MRRNSDSGDLSRKFVKRSCTGPSRVSALAVSFQSSWKRPFTKNASRPSASELGSVAEVAQEELAVALRVEHRHLDRAHPRRQDRFGDEVALLVHRHGLPGEPDAV